MTRLFDELGLNKELLLALKENGYTTPFPIQEKAIPIILQGNDVIGQAHTGTGKTAAYSLPILMKMKNTRNAQALVLVPTRELAIQVAGEMNKLANYTETKVAAIYGGQNMRNQIIRLERGVHIIVATPGRLIDHIGQKTVYLNSIDFVVLDEADRMLDMGFIEDINYILSKLKHKKQLCLFSATIFPEIIEISKKYMKNPIHVTVNQNDITLKTIEQMYLIINEKEKYNYLCDLIKQSNNNQIVIFTSTKHKAEQLAMNLRKKELLKVTALHGDLSQRQRNYAMHKFRNEQEQILVATDIAARGIDIPSIKYVINYDIPRDPLTYFHRIGRTARANSDGKAISLVAIEKISDFEKILKHTKYNVRQLNEEIGIPIPKIQKEFKKHNYLNKNKPFNKWSKHNYKNSKKKNYNYKKSSNRNFRKH
ncbi:MAG: DEAD-box ATP-dependent helicase [Nitrososphaeraceae archaeon]|nr:DEAD-box ATP-dependent helicase [Nitrososphaeraceae archaeon]